MNLNLRKISIILILISVIMLSNNFAAGNASSSTPPVVIGNITDAFYANLNNQSYYDIQYNMTVNITDFTASNALNGYYYTLIVGLTYPDGSTYWYQFNLVSYNQTFGLRVIFYDSVTQTGWYTAQSYTFSTYGKDQAYYSCMEFDPPSLGTLGTPPI